MPLQELVDVVPLWASPSFSFIYIYTKRKGIFGVKSHFSDILFTLGFITSFQVKWSNFTIVTLVFETTNSVALADAI